MTETKTAPAPLPKTSAPEHVHRMRLALDEAKKSVPTPTAFCVGCIITSSSGTILSSGYSRELEGNTHAEQCALTKLGSPEAAAPFLEGASIYTTMEPCSLRLSGYMPCVQRVLQTSIQNVYIGVQEPSDFVECEGTRLLRECGRQVWVVEAPGLAEECLEVARKGH
ncbi:cytidine deaminase-like protein [Leucosporidium creatinivorum]|uniref:Cytidine deaminase-like protein n=1 Tax=Leucosporidium creatinivorum TaxID=106004 RepID=A0A1Y2D4S7_9BASI|nr:cytidine deaminase-like protein [Leucosporidium creatinivorum]